MKKRYSKPEIMFESFTLSVNIAGDCEIKIDNQSQNTCGYIQGTGGETLFINASTGCSFEKEDNENNGFCYHIPIESNNLFNS